MPVEGFWLHPLGFTMVLHPHSLYIYIYTHGDYSVIDDRIIFCTYSILLTTYVYTSYDTCLYCFVWQNRTAHLQIWTANLYLRSYLFEFINHFSELCKWYIVGKLRKIRNFFMLNFFLIFNGLSLILKIGSIQKHVWNIFFTYFPNHKSE
jgi:hypothetical protein